MALVSVVSLSGFNPKQPTQPPANNNTHHPVLMARLLAAVFPENPVGMAKTRG
jgi:hypothetical protein